MTDRNGRFSWLLDLASVVMIGLAIIIGIRNLWNRPQSDGRSSVVTQDVKEWRGYANASFRLGASTAKYTIVEFSDFACVYCQRMAPVVRQVREEIGEDVTFVYRHAMFRPNARPLALATECAARQGVAEALHDELFSNRGSLPSDGWPMAALRAGAGDTVTFKLCLESADAASAVLNDSIATSNLGVRGTPTFLLNNVLVEGSLSAEDMKELLGVKPTMISRIRKLFVLQK
jgi:protein-disulfide isomerase